MGITDRKLQGTPRNRGDGYEQRHELCSTHGRNLTLLVLLCHRYKYSDNHWIY